METDIKRLEPLNEEEKPEVELVGQDGNVFFIIGAVSKALKKADKPEYAREFRNRAMKSSSYDDVLILLHEYCNPY